MQDAPTEKRYLRKQFDVPAGKKVASATLAVTADDVVAGRLNGREIGTSANWQNPMRVEVADTLRSGANVLAMVVENTKGDVKPNPAGFLASLDVRFADGDSLRIVSDATWRAAKSETAGWDATEFDDSAWPLAVAIGGYGMPPWGILGTNPAHEPPYALGVADGVRVIYSPRPDAVEIRALKPERAYAASYFDPVTGERSSIGDIRSDNAGVWTCPPPKAVKEEDWVVILEPAAVK
jgi:hypothetical protein